MGERYVGRFLAYLCSILPDFNRQRAGAVPTAGLLVFISEVAWKKDYISGKLLAFDFVVIRCDFCQITLTSYFVTRSVSPVSLLVTNLGFIRAYLLKNTSLRSTSYRVGQKVSHIGLLLPVALPNRFLTTSYYIRCG